MRGTVELLRVQCRMLRWPLLALIAGYAVIALTQDIRDWGFLAPICGGFLTTLLVLFSGPIVFGFEYSEGARDYLATRPARTQVVFWVKMFALVLFVAVATCLLPLSWGTNGPHRKLLIIAIGTLGSGFLDIAVWCALVTILFKDIVRGILYGVATLVLISATVAYVWAFQFIPWVSGISSVSTALDTGGASFSSMVCLHFTPLLLLALLAIVHRSQSRKRLSISISCVPLLVLFVLGVGSAIWMVYNKGVVSFAENDPAKHFPPAYGRVLAKRVQNNRLTYVCANTNRPNTRHSPLFDANKGLADVLLSFLS